MIRSRIKRVLVLIAIMAVLPVATAQSASAATSCKTGDIYYRYTFLGVTAVKYHIKATWCFNGSRVTSASVIPDSTPTLTWAGRAVGIGNVYVLRQQKRYYSWNGHYHGGYLSYNTLELVTVKMYHHRRGANLFLKYNGTTSHTYTVAI